MIEHYIHNKNTYEAHDEGNYPAMVPSLYV